MEAPPQPCARIPQVVTAVFRLLKPAKQPTGAKPIRQLIDVQWPSMAFQVVFKVEIG